MFGRWHTREQWSVNLPLAAAGAVVAALSETSVLPELTILGAKPDLVLVMAIMAAMFIGTEEALMWAFLGGLMLDLLVPERPAGATVFSVLVVTGIALVAARVAGNTRRIVAVLLTFALTFVYQGLTLAVLSATTGVAASSISLSIFGVTAVLNTTLAIVTSGVMRWYLLRFAPPERAEWLGA